MQTTLILNLVLASFLCGLIWTIQLVHYPGFMKVGKQGFIDYQAFHMRSITVIVGPMMVLELMAATWLAVQGGFNPINWGIISSLVIVVALWAITFFGASPVHYNLYNNGYDPELIRKLVNINWSRTILWTIRTILLGWMVIK
jgi:hypothetical protein